MRALAIAALLALSAPAAAQPKGDQPPAAATADDAARGEAKGQGQQAATSGSRMTKSDREGAASTPKP